MVTEVERHKIAKSMIIPASDRRKTRGVPESRTRRQFLPRCISYN